ncbi:hypothetical protein AAMO2058_001062000 [Amorphochlora amoebiformis]
MEARAPQTARRSPRTNKGLRQPTYKEELMSAKKGPAAISQSVMLAHKWAGAKEPSTEAKRGTKGIYVDPKGWHMSEKLDGLRAYYDGDGRLYSRNGNRIHAPKWFTDVLPDGVSLDGELWCGRGRFQEAVSICRRNEPGKEWTNVRYMVFDAPNAKGGFEKRLGLLKRVVEDISSSHLAAVPFLRCKGVSHLQESLKAVEAKGGEGLMLRKPASNYEGRRSESLLKVKTFFDEEALVVGKKKGTGKNMDVMGALFCELPNGTQFKVGSGFTDAERRRPPKKGSIITFKFQETTRDGIPRFPTFLRVREDVTWEEVKASYSKKKKDGCDPYKAGKDRKVATLSRRHSVLWSSGDSKTNQGPKVTKFAIPSEPTADVKTQGKKSRKRSREPEDDGDGLREDWGCLRCTFVNPGVNRYCGMCGCKNFKPKREQPMKIVLPILNR